MNVSLPVRVWRWLRDPWRCRSVLHTHRRYHHRYRCHRPRGPHPTGSHAGWGLSFGWTQDQDLPEGDLYTW